jgi:hypothetical protein
MAAQAANTSVTIAFRGDRLEIQLLIDRYPLGHALRRFVGSPYRSHAPVLNMKYGFTLDACSLMTRIVSRIQRTSLGTSRRKFPSF